MNYTVPIGSESNAGRVHEFLADNGITVHGVAIKDNKDGSFTATVDADQDPTQVLSGYTSQPTRAESARENRRAFLESYADMVDRGQPPSASQTARAIADIIGMLKNTT